MNLFRIACGDWRWMFRFFFCRLVRGGREGRWCGRTTTDETATRDWKGQTPGETHAISGYGDDVCVLVRAVLLQERFMRHLTMRRLRDSVPCTCASFGLYSQLRKGLWISPNTTDLYVARPGTKCTHLLCVIFRYSTQLCSIIAQLSKLYTGEWVNLAMLVRCTWFYEHLYCTDSVILLHFLMTN